MRERGRRSVQFQVRDERRRPPLTIRVIAETWNNRDAMRLSNGVMEAVLLRGGGHIAELCAAGPDSTALNCLWAAPWQTMDPCDPNFKTLAREYGAAPAGEFLAAYTGHALCLDIFGPPSEQDAARGVPLHGEAAARMWDIKTNELGCSARVELPLAQLEFERSVSLAEDSAALFIEERLHNRGAAVREIHWVQHLSLGLPFLEPGCSAIDGSLDRGCTWRLGYEGRAALRDDTEFAWPLAPGTDGATLDLRIPFVRPGYGFVAAVRVNIVREYAYVAALNWRIGQVLVYCFRREDFPWIAIWEENCARAGAPWNGTAQVRGMEFGTTPMPLGRDAVRAMGDLFGTPGSRIIRSGETLYTRYLAAIAPIPSDWREITDVVPGRDALTISGPHNSRPVTVAAAGIDEFFEKSK
jgi:hypothetical protein